MDWAWREDLDWWNWGWKGRGCRGGVDYEGFCGKVRRWLERGYCGMRVSGLKGSLEGRGLALGLEQFVFGIGYNTFPLLYAFLVFVGLVRCSQ